MYTIGKRIRYIRKSKGMSLSDVSVMTGLSTGNLSELENDKFSPSSKSLILFSRLFNVSIDWLLTGKEFSSNEIVKEDWFYYTDEETELIKLFRTLSKESKRDLLGYLRTASSIQKKKK